MSNESNGVPAATGAVPGSAIPGSSIPDSAAVPMAIANGGHASNGLPVTSANGHAASRDASFWQRPLDAGGLSETYWHPPLPAHSSLDAGTTALLHEIAELHARSGPDGEGKTYQSWYLRWFYETRARAAQRELEDVIAEVHCATRNYATLLRDSDAASAPSRAAADNALLDETPQSPDVTLDVLLARARHDFTDAAAAAGLYVVTAATVEAQEPRGAPNATSRTNTDLSAPDGTSQSSSRTSVPNGQISPQRVEEALREAAPRPAEVAGMYRLRYPQSEWHGDEPMRGGHNWLDRLTASLLHLAPLVLGLMVALCLGSVSGLVDIEDITRRPDAAKVFKFLLAVGLGGVVVAVLGKATEATMRILFDHLVASPLPQSNSAPAAAATGDLYQEAKLFRDNTPPAPRRRKLAVGVCLATLLLFGIAETVAESTGLRTLNDLRLANMSQAQLRQYNQNPIPPVIFYLVGLLFSASYLFYKGSETWRRGELEMLRPWLERRRQEWIEEQRRKPEIQKLFQLAYLIEQMEARRHELRIRLDNARAAAVAEAELLHAMLEWIVNQRETMPMPTQHLVRSFGTSVEESGADGVRKRMGNS